MITFVHSRYLESVIKIQRNKETDDCSAPHPLLLALDRIGDLLFEEMCVALCNAAKSGVDVRIVTPGIPDKKLVFFLTQSYYQELLKANVKIYQFAKGFKMCIRDRN